MDLANGSEWAVLLWSILLSSGLSSFAWNSGCPTALHQFLCTWEQYLGGPPTGNGGN